MLELTFYRKIDEKNYEAEIIEVSQKCYEILAKIGFSKKVEYKSLKLSIEGEKYDVNATELNKINRDILLIILEQERHSQFKESFRNIDNNPSIKEIREEFYYINELTKIYDFLNSCIYQYFSYE